MLDADGKPLAPCTPRGARMLIDRKRVARRYYRPFTIQLKSRANDDPVQNNTEVRSTPGRRTTGIAVVLKTPREDHKNLDTFLAENPERSTAVLHRAHHRKPLTAAGAIAWICQTLVRRLQSRELTVRTTNRRRHRRHPKAARNPEEPRRRRHLLRDRPSRHPATGAREAQGRGPRPPQADQRPCRRHRTCTGG